MDKVICNLTENEKKEIKDIFENYRISCQMKGYIIN